MALAYIGGVERTKGRIFSGILHSIRKHQESHKQVNKALPYAGRHKTSVWVIILLQSRHLEECKLYHLSVTSTSNFSSRWVSSCAASNVILKVFISSEFEFTFCWCGCRWHKRAQNPTAASILSLCAGVSVLAASWIVLNCVFYGSGGTW